MNNAIEGEIEVGVVADDRIHVRFSAKDGTLFEVTMSGDGIVGEFYQQELVEHACQKAAEALASVEDDLQLAAAGVTPARLKR